MPTSDRPRLQGGGHHHHPVRHGDAQRPRPLPPGEDVIDAVPGLQSHAAALRQADGRRAGSLPCVHRVGGEDPPDISKLDMDALSDDRAADLKYGSEKNENPGRQAGRAASSCPCSTRPTACWRRRPSTLRSAASTIGTADSPSRRLPHRRDDGHRIVHGGTKVHPAGAHRRPRAAPAGGTDRPGAVAPAQVAPGARPGSAACSPGAAVGCASTPRSTHTSPPAAATTHCHRAVAPRWDLRRFGFHGLSHAYASRRARS